MINVKSVINRTVEGAMSNAVQGGLGAIGGLQGALTNMVGGLNIFGGFGGLFSGNAFSTGGKVVTLGFKRGHPYAGYPGILRPLAQTNGVAWPYRPSIEISRPVNYETNTPVHSMQEFRSFRNNSSANFTISGQFTAQTIEEGEYLQAALHFTRVATMMSFGKGGAVPPGMPPPVLSLNAYGPNNINNLPVVIDSLMQSYPPDVDYISVNGNDVPTSMSITATCTVMLAPEQLRYFNLDSFASGNMQGWL